MRMRGVTSAHCIRSITSTSAASCSLGVGLSVAFARSSCDVCGDTATSVVRQLRFGRSACSASGSPDRASRRRHQSASAPLPTDTYLLPDGSWTVASPRGLCRLPRTASCFSSAPTLHINFATQRTGLRTFNSMESVIIAVTVGVSTSRPCVGHCDQAHTLSVRLAVM